MNDISNPTDQETDAEIAQAKKEVAEFFARYRIGPPLNVRHPLEVTADVSALRDRSQTPGQALTLRWLITCIPLLGGELTIGLADLAEEMQVSPRTLARYIRAWQESGILDVQRAPDGPYTFRLSEETAAVVLA